MRADSVDAGDDVDDDDDDADDNRGAADNPGAAWDADVVSASTASSDFNGPDGNGYSSGLYLIFKCYNFSSKERRLRVRLEDRRYFQDNHGIYTGSSLRCKPLTALACDGRSVE